MGGGPTVRRTRSWTWVAAGLLITAAAGTLLFQFITARGKAPTQPGAIYISDIEVIRRECRALTGKELAKDAEREIQRAGELARGGDYRAAADALFPLVQAAPTASLYNNLGTLYFRLGDYPNARDSFRRALAQNARHDAARRNLGHLHTPGLISELPVTREVEPNDSLVRANVVSAGVPVSAAIQSGGDTDTYRFAAPGAPRDILAASVESRSASLAVALRLFDGEGRFLELARGTEKPGAELTRFLSPAPGSRVYLQVFSQRGALGEYSITVKPLHAFDGYEPNDDLFHASRLPFDTAIEANIMDTRDTDAYELVSPHSGQVEAAVENRSATLIPGLAVFGPDRVLIGFGPDQRDPGSSVRYAFTALAGQRYYVQVSGSTQSSGRYALTIGGR